MSLDTPVVLRPRHRRRAPLGTTSSARRTCTCTRPRAGPHPGPRRDHPAQPRRLRRQRRRLLELARAVPRRRSTRARPTPSCENVSGALEGDTAEIDQLINSGARVSHTVGGLDTQVGQVIGSLDQVLTAIASRSGDVGAPGRQPPDGVPVAGVARTTLLDDVVGNLSSVSARPGQAHLANQSTLDSTIDDLNTVTRRSSRTSSALAPGAVHRSARAWPPTPRSRPSGSGSRSRPSTPAWPTRRPAPTTSRSTHRPARARAGTARRLPPLGGRRGGRLGRPPRGERVGVPGPVHPRRRRFDGPDGCRFQPARHPRDGGRHPDRSRERAVKAFTERNPRRSAWWPWSVMAAVVLGVLFLNRSLFPSGYQVTARFPNAAGHRQGHPGAAGRRARRERSSAVTSTGNAVDATMTIDDGVVLPHAHAAPVQVETLLGVVDVTLEPVSGWAPPLRRGRADHRHLRPDGVLPAAEHGGAPARADRRQGAQPAGPIAGLDHPGASSTRSPEIIDGLGRIDVDGRPAQRRRSASSSTRPTPCPPRWPTTTSS